MPVHAHDGAERLEPERMRQAAQKRGVLCSHASRPELFTVQNLGLLAQLPMPRGRQLEIRRWRHAINHPPAWLTTIFIWDGCRAPYVMASRRPAMRENLAQFFLRI
jgi:hypothetical protein